MINTFMFTNMVPQHDRFNQRIWENLERFVRDWATLKGEIYVIAGSILDKDGNGQRDADSDADLVQPTDRVAIPTHFFKIVLHERPNGFIESMTFLLPHVDDSPTFQQAKPFLRNHLTNIDEIEELTGVDFLHGLEDTKENAVENFTATELWPTGGST